MLLSLSLVFSESVVWARQVSNGKVFFDALGHDAESFNHPKHSEIIIRAKNWITDKEKDH